MKRTVFYSMLGVYILAHGIMLIASGDIVFCYLGIVGAILWCCADIQDEIKELKQNRNFKIPVVVKDVHTKEIIEKTELTFVQVIKMDSGNRYIGNTKSYIIKETFFEHDVAILYVKEC